MNTIEKKISSVLARFVKENIGIGPLKVETTLTNSFVLVHTKGHLLPFESELVRNDTGYDQIKSNRVKWVALKKNMLMEIISDITRAECDRLFYDFDPHLNESVLVVYKKISG